MRSSRLHNTKPQDDVYSGRWDSHVGKCQSGWRHVKLIFYL